jgi:hypothetical protein
MKRRQAGPRDFPSSGAPAPSTKHAQGDNLRFESDGIETEALGDAMVNSFVADQTSMPAAIRVGGVFNRAIGLFISRWAPFIGLSLVAYAPNFLYALATAGAPGAQGLSAASLQGFLLVVIRLACSSLASAAIIYGVVQELRGRTFTFGDSLRIGFGRIGAVIGLSLLVGILVALAMILLIVPGIIVLCIFAVAVPVCVVEGLGPRASMSRSSFLTKGNRWRIFGIFVVIFIFSLIFGAIVGFVAARLGGLPLVQISVFLIEGIVGAFNSVTVGVLYYLLRVAREGADIEKIASVFD